MKKKTLGDYIYINGGRHEFVAFVKDLNKNKSILETRLDVPFGILVCDRKNSEDKKDKAKFYYKLGSEFGDYSDISYIDFSYSAKVISEIPLVISADFNNHHYLRKDDKRYDRAKELLKSHGLY